MASEGEQLGRYHLVRKLATGGMAEVFLAKAVGPGGFEKSLVIKRILPNLANDPEFVSMFLQEARMAAQFAHPAVAQIFDFGEVNGTYFLAMEYVDGPNLRSILRAAPEQRLPFAVGARVIEEACEGLAYVHEFADPSGKPLGLIHCDVSTDNMLIARNGAVKVVDFGVSKSGTQQSNAAPGTVKGKIAYMPPEQIIGEADLRADVYALGVILYEIAAGTRPYERMPDPQLLAAIIQTDPVPLLQRRPDVPVEYANIVKKAMAKQLSVRFQNCRELASALEEFVANSGHRVGTRQLAALATQYEEPPAQQQKAPGSGPKPFGATASGGEQVMATPHAKMVSPSRISPPKGVPVATSAPLARSDPFAAFGAAVGNSPTPAPVKGNTGNNPAFSPPAASPSQVARSSTQSLPPPPSAPPPASPGAPGAAKPSRADVLFDQFFSDLNDSGSFKAKPSAPPAPAAPAAKPAPAPPSASANKFKQSKTGGFSVVLGEPDEPEAVEPEKEDDAGGMKITVGTSASGVMYDSLKRPSSPNLLSNLTPGTRANLTPGTRSNLTPGTRPPESFADLTSNLTPGTRANLTPGTRGNLTPGTRANLTPGTSANLTPGTQASRITQPLPAPPSRSGVNQAFVPAPSAPPAPVLNTPEARAAMVMADASAMRLYEADSGAIASPAEIEPLLREFERDEGVQLLVRYPGHVHRLMKIIEAEPLLSERVAGAVDGLFMAEAWGPLASLLERLKLGANTDAQHKWVYEYALSIFATADQARRISLRLREAPPSDVEGLGRLIPYFGPAFAELWLGLFENLDLAASRDAILPGLAGLAAQNPAPFLERLQPKRPRRLMELTYCLEKGKVGARVTVMREMLSRLDPSRRREVLSGLARAGSDEGFKLVCAAVTEDQNAPEAAETRLHAIQLLGKHFPDRVFSALEGVLAPSSSGAWSENERRAMWVAVGQSTSPAAFEAVTKEVLARAPLLGRAKADQRKVDVLEALAVMKSPQAAQLMRQIAEDSSQADVVRQAADRHVRSAELVEHHASHVSETRRWDRNPPGWRDVLIDLAALAGASRLVELDSASFDPAFTRLSKTLAALLPAGAQAVVACSPTLTVNGAPVNDGADLAVDRILKAFGARAIGGFTFTRQPPRAELELLVRWLAAGSNAEGIELNAVTLVSSNGAMPKPAKLPPRVPPMTDFSREAMIRYVDLVLSFRAWFQERKTNPRAPMPDTSALFHELAAAMSSRHVRFCGLVPRTFDRNAEVFHAANVAIIAMGFAAELGLQHQQIEDLGTWAFFADVGNFDLKDDTFAHAGKLSDAEQADVATARKISVRWPFLKLGDKPGATAWSAMVSEQDLDWGTREFPGTLGLNATIGSLGAVLALCRAWESLTSASPSRPEPMTKEAALEVLTQKASHRFRPDVLALFAKYLAKQSFRPLGK
ncbi:MAG: protein kinase [Archangium sp.]|nr:protein kinase [Archangium sp.]